MGGGSGSMGGGVKPILERYRGKVGYAGPQHGKVRQAKNLIDNVRPNPERLVVIEGIWAHQRAADCGVAVQSLLVCPEMVHSPEALALTERYCSLAEDVYVLSEKVFHRIAERDEPNGLVSICRMPRWGPDDLAVGAESLILVLDGIEIPGNIGTILRSADGAGADGVFICNKRARVSHPKVVRGSMGACFKVPIVEWDDPGDAIRWLAGKGYRAYLADTRAERTYREYGYEGRTAIVSGSERYGIGKAWYSYPGASLVSIPMRGICDSLNVAVATTILAYEAAVGRRGRDRSG
ncbi:MAG: hypothetical protein FWE70_03110 [Oscillospiraceae bacterium]|nr:hypothetical protein [Oscillospiraceae bacterium]